MQSDGKKILDQQKQRTLCSRLRMELLGPLRVVLVNRGPDMELLVANPVEVSGKGRPLVFYDITLALKNLHKRIFLVCAINRLSVLVSGNYPPTLVTGPNCALT